MLRTILLVLAVSIDGLGVGLVYSLWRITLPASSLLFIALLSATAIFAAVIAGDSVAVFLNPLVAERAGGALLLLIECWLLVQTCSERLKTAAGTVSRSVVCIRNRSPGLIVQIVSEPVAADVEKPGHASLREAAVLGTALSFRRRYGCGGLRTVGTVHALARGAGAIVIIRIGVWLGCRFRMRFLHPGIDYLPGALLLILGLRSIFQKDNISSKIVLHPEIAPDLKSDVVSLNGKMKIHNGG